MPASVMKVSIDGQDLSEFSEDAILESVEVRQALNEHWWCDIQCRQTSDKRFPIEDSLGKDLQVTGEDEEGEQVVLFDGFILEAELDYEMSGSFTASIRGVTRSYNMDLTPRQAYYRQASLSDVANKLAGLVGLSVDLIYTPKSPPLTYTQWGETDFEFLKRLADDHECWLRPTAQGIQIFNAFQDEGTTAVWRGEEGLRSFKIKGKLGQPSMNGAHYCRAVMKSRTYAAVQDSAEFLDGAGPMVDAVKQASQDKLPAGYIHQRVRVVTQDDYEKLLKKESRRAIGSKIVGYGASRNEDLLPGDLISIEGSLDAQGSYGLIHVVHRWTTTGYMNEFQCTPWKTYTNPEPPGKRNPSGPAPSPSVNQSLQVVNQSVQVNQTVQQVVNQYIQQVVPQTGASGLACARVVDNVDPSKAGRVQVQYPWQEDSQTIWARTMTPHAGSDRGFYFIPEIGDEVVVGFEGGDPEQPIVIGSIWNGADSPPTEDFWGGEYANNDCKRIVTKSGHRITIVDKEGKETISLATPKHVKMMMTESSNETGDAMFSLHCDGDIVLTAGGRIHMKSAYYSREVG
jgi:uncharacterized protein involved in type VI secretion and phage assembly